MWDTAAAGRLDLQVQQLRTCGLLDVLQETIAKVWRANLGRHEPSELGDTAQSLGFTSWVNVAQLVVRHYANLTPQESEGVRAALISSTLMIRVRDIRVQVMKAPPSSSRTPDWNQFTWLEADSQVRFRAAQNNIASYNPVTSDQDGRAQSLQPDHGPSMLWDAPSDPAGLCDLVLVWSGEFGTALTAGWLGMPCLGTPPWFAVAPLWVDEGDQRIPSSDDVVPHPGDEDNFADRPEPALVLGLKTVPDEKTR